MDHYKDFTDRLTVLSMGEQFWSGRFLKLENGESVDFRSFTGSVVVMSICDQLRYRMHNGFCDQEAGKVHVSASGGEMMPYFVQTSPMLAYEANEAINSMYKWLLFKIINNFNYFINKNK